MSPFALVPGTLRDRCEQPSRAGGDRCDQRDRAHVRRPVGRRRGTASRRGGPLAYAFRAVRGRLGRLQPDAPRRHRRHVSGQPVGVRPRDADRGPHGEAAQGLVRAHGAAPLPGAVLEAGLAGRDALVHGQGDRPAGGRGGRGPGRRRVPGRQPGRRGQADGHRDRRGAEAGLIDMGLLDGRVAVVTGSGRGIGREFALCMAREGASVVVNDVGVSLDGRGTDEDPAAQVCKEIEALGGEAVPNYDSVSDFEEAANIVATATDAFGQLDILVNNAGIVRDRSLLKMTEDDFDAVLAVHLKGSFNCARHAAPVMKDAGYGRIINITSSAGLRGNFGQTNYGAAKAALMGLTFIWALELGKYGITVNAVAPAGATRMTASLFERSGEEPRPEQNPALNAPLVAFLASERASHVNGQILGRTDYAYTLFQHPKQIAFMWRDGGWEPGDVADNFDAVLGQHLQTVGMVMPSG